LDAGRMCFRSCSHTTASSLTRECCCQQYGTAMLAREWRGRRHSSRILLGSAAGV
jgi:hypothetical protein